MWSVFMIIIPFVLRQCFCEIIKTEIDDKYYSVGLTKKDTEDRAKWRRISKKAESGFSRTERDEQSGEIRRSRKIKIIGLFDNVAEVQLKAFNDSMRSASKGELRLRPFMLTPFRSDSYSFWRELCKNDESPIIVVGPQNPVADRAIKDQCYKSYIPYIQVSWKPNDPDLEEGVFNETDEDKDLFLAEPPTIEEEEVQATQDPSITFKNIAINFYPDLDEVAQAYSELMKYFKWEGFTALYEDDLGLLRVQKVLALHTGKLPVTLRKLDPVGDNKNIFKDLALYQESRIYLDCHARRIYKYMEEADAIHMVNHYQHYMLGAMDASISAENLTRFQSNITWLSITEYDKLMDPQHFLAQRVGRWVSKDINLISAPVTSLETEALMMDDAANHILKALEAVSSATIDEAHPTCSDEKPWEGGVVLQNKLLEAVTTGVSGRIEFDQTGKRVNYTLHVNQINVSTRNTIGFWKSANASRITMNQKSHELGGQQSSKHFLIIARKAKPFFYPKTRNPGEEPDPDDDGLDFEGFSVDLVKGIFDYLKKELKYNYTYSFVTEEYKSIGKYNTETRKWDGVFGAILEKKADLAVCDITITEERKKYVDFSVPFMNLGISILHTKWKKPEPEMFAFLNPYSFEVWMYTLTAFCLVSMVMYICSRISPADWENPQPCNKDPEELENIWNFKNCLWLAMGSIMTQGCDILPKAIGSRWVCGMWWFFAMIVCQTYIAQLSASMTVALSDAPIDSIEDLAKQNKILYGALNGGSTLEFFKNSKNKMYHRMYETMTGNPVVLVDDIDEGEKRVIKGRGKYAFFMESSSIKYKLRRNCDLKEVGNKLDSKDYGIAMPSNSPFRSQINAGVLYLRDKTWLDAIQKKWWDIEYGANNSQCVEETKEGDVEGDLEYKNLKGVFVVLIVGLFIALLISAAEFMNEVRNIVVKEKITHKEAFTREIKFALNFFKTEKPVESRHSSIESSEESSEDENARKEKRNLFLGNFLDLEKIQQ